MNQRTKTIILETKSLLTKEKEKLSACRYSTFKSMRILALKIDKLCGIGNGDRKIQLTKIT